ncbi:MAG: 50S ribosomal protein L25 [Deltaproteobacteria bacterium]|nr:50S ribosomal protein L25 [Deltaproteobacteria bacterium]
MEEITLSAQPREKTGKCPSRRLRSEGLIPAVLYGPNVEGALSLTFSDKELEKVLHTAAGGNVLVNLDIKGDKGRKVMFKEVLRHPLRGTLQHVDLLEILMDHKVTLEIPVHITGKAAGLAFGGIVQHEARRIKVECLPSQIPDSIDFDITPLGIGDSFHVKDINLPEGVVAVDEPELTIVSIVAPAAEVAPKTAEEVEAELAQSFAEKEEEGEEKKEK